MLRRARLGGGAPVARRRAGIVWRSMLSDRRARGLGPEGRPPSACASLRWLPSQTEEHLRLLAAATQARGTAFMSTTRRSTSPLNLTRAGGHRRLAPFGRPSARVPFGTLRSGPILRAAEDSCPARLRGIQAKPCAASHSSGLRQRTRGWWDSSRAQVRTGGRRHAQAHPRVHRVSVTSTRPRRRPFSRSSACRSSTYGVLQGPLVVSCRLPAPPLLRREIAPGGWRALHQSTNALMTGAAPPHQRLVM
jgi:hypothetical protein